ncbi:MAG: hypothetical protein H7X77_02020 [Anaerolineae bacterium]|nr:hypothetical protein [Anaerolineae bacterium]
MSTSESTLAGLHRKIRWITILWGLAVFLWLAVEDNTVLPVVLLGSSGAFLIVSLRITRMQPMSRLRLILGGSLTGLGASVLTTLLMLLKNGQHSHLYPDFPLALMGAMLTRAPIWILAGGLGGLGLVLLIKVEK